MIAERNINRIGLDVALGAKAILRDLRIEDVRLKSAGAATFYVWVGDQSFLSTEKLLNRIK